VVDHADGVEGLGYADAVADLLLDRQGLLEVGEGLLYITRGVVDPADVGVFCISPRKPSFQDSWLSDRRKPTIVRRPEHLFDVRADQSGRE
jgi:hypothetical protein